MKSKKIRIGSKITILVLSVVLISVLSVSYIAFDLSKQSIGERYEESLNVMADLRVQKVENFFQQVKSRFFRSSFISDQKSG
jgi:hypothetical protein